MPHKKPASKTSWEPVEKWYNRLVGDEGHYYHRRVIIPGVLRLLENPKSVLDLACGTGVLARHLPDETTYLGVDAAPSLIKAAKEADQAPHRDYLIADITKPLKLKNNLFTHATILLAAQNVESPLEVFRNAQRNLEKGGKFIMVINHPCFRIPRQSSWQVDQQKKIQYRRIDRYLSTMKIPIQMHPGKGKESPTSLSFHHPLSHYVRWLYEAGFVIECLEEWCSDKVSVGGAAKMENQSRAEFPLFLAIRAKKE